MKFNKPSEYQKLDRLNICSNVLIGAGAIVKIGELEPILIGEGLNFPAIWLKARTNEGDWVSVVERSISLNSQVRVINVLGTCTTEITTDETIILKARQQGAECFIDQLDLRPLGFNMYGSSQFLKVGESEFIGNTFQGVGTFIGINE